MDITLAINQLTCSSCNKSLSHYPIFLTANNENICGRCSIPSGTVAFHNTIFELTIKTLKFPCQYQSEGCFETFIPKEISQHEAQCPFKPIQCIVQHPVPCKWSSSFANLGKHLKNDHCDLILANGDFQIDLKTEECFDSLLEQNDVIFVFRRKLTNVSMFYWVLFPVSNEENIQDAYLTLHNENTSLSNKFCTSLFKETTFNKISLSSVMQDDKKLNGTVAFRREGEVPSLSSQAVSLLACAACNSFAFPPFYRRTKNMDLLCKNCKSLYIRTCQKCFRVSQKNDGVLSQVASLLQYPCKNRKNGCEYHAQPKEMEEHEFSCDYKTTLCPLKCAWDGARKNLNKHLAEHEIVNGHNEMVFEGPVLELIKFANKFFRLEHYSSPSVYTWMVEELDEFDGFKYEIEIFEGSFRIVLGQNCVPFGERQWFCYCEEKQIFWKRGGALKFKVRIYK